MHRVVLLDEANATAEIIASDAQPSLETLLLYKALLDQLARRQLIVSARGRSIHLCPPNPEWNCGGVAGLSSASIQESVARLASYSLEARGLSEQKRPSFTRPFPMYGWGYVESSPTQWTVDISFPDDLLGFLAHRVNENSNWIEDGLFPGIDLPIRSHAAGFDGLIMIISDQTPI